MEGGGVSGAVIGFARGEAESEKKEIERGRAPFGLCELGFLQALFLCVDDSWDLDPGHPDPTRSGPCFFIIVGPAPLFVS